MAKTTEDQRIDQRVRAVLASMGIVMPTPRTRPEQSADYIEHGSDAHRQFLGLVVVKDGDDITGYTPFTSLSGTTYRLANELEAVRHFPGVDPEKAAVLLLRGKVNSLESDHPKAPVNAPRMWTPTDVGPQATLALVGV